MSTTLGKLERFVLFCGFVLLTGGLVGGLYYMVNATPPAGASAGTGPTAIATLTAAPAATQPMITPLQFVAVPDAPVKDFASAMPVLTHASTLPQMNVDSPASAATDARPSPRHDDLSAALLTSPSVEPARDVTHNTPPTTQPTAIAVQTLAAPVIAAAQPATQPTAPAMKSAELIIPIAAADPYQINVGASHVIHMYTSEDADPACWYELKLEPSQLDVLRAAALAIGQHEHADVDEFDHLAELPPAADTALRWWRPEQLSDLNLLSVSADGSDRVWLAMSRRTGRVFLYACKAVDFGSL